MVEYLLPTPPVIISMVLIISGTLGGTGNGRLTTIVLYASQRSENYRVLFLCFPFSHPSQYRHIEVVRARFKRPWERRKWCAWGFRMTSDLISAHTDSSKPSWIIPAIALGVFQITHSLRNHRHS